ncbi:MAG: CHAT domain-containing tetratricopeptide repeat protein [Armatimonadota bacterium]
METLSLLENFERADLTSKRALLKTHKPPSGFSEQYFLRVAKLLGENPIAARNLAEGWEIVGKFGDDPSFAWRAKGALERIRGNWDSSAKAFVHSGTLAKGSIEKISFKTGAIDSLARAGKTDSAVRLGKSIAVKLEALGELGLAGRAWLNTGNAYLWADRHHDARRCFARAFECLRNSPFKLEAASALLGASSAALYTDFPSKTFALAAEARDSMAEMGATAYSRHAQVNVGQCHLLMGEADESIRIFSELRSLSDPDSLEFARLGQFLGDAWLVLQVFESAGNAFQSAIHSKGIHQSPLNLGNSLVGLGDVKLFQGNATEAKGLYVRAARIYRKFGDLALVNLAQIGVARSEIALGRKKQAEKVLKESIVDLRKRRMFHFLVGALLDLASITKENEEILAEASRIIRRFGFVNEAWRIHAIRANKAESVQTALSEYRKMVKAILSYRAKLSSVTARTSLIQPCLVSIRSYLSLLIERNSTTSIKEAIQVISDLRSITLLDEFMLGSSNSFNEKAQSILSQIRQEVSAEGGDQLPGGPLRQLEKGTQSKPSLVREYLEQIGVNQLLEGTPERSALSPIPVNSFVFLTQGSAWLSREKGRRLKMTREDLIKRLRWIHFELMAPLSGFESDVKRLNQELDRLRADLGVEFLESHHNILHVCLEDVAYQIPWALLTPQETVLHLRSSAGTSPDQHVLGSNPKVGIWYFSRKDLPHIECEVEQIRSLFPDAKIFSTVDEILKSTADQTFDLIHVAGHGKYDHENPMFSSIQLQDGHLLACDIARSSFRTRFATLASCDSASMGQPSGWEPQGLARAFLARRSEVVIGSLWPLNDQVAEYGFGSFYRKLKDGKSVSSSLCEARADIKSKFVDPAYWGSLVMFGGYSQ